MFVISVFLPDGSAVFRSCMEINEVVIQAFCLGPQLDFIHQIIGKLHLRSDCVYRLLKVLDFLEALK